MQTYVALLYSIILGGIGLERCDPIGGRRLAHHPHRHLIASFGRLGRERIAGAIYYVLRSAALGAGAKTAKA
jgi:hypothetical protein